MTRNPNRNPEVSPEGSGSGATWRSYVAEVPSWLIVFGTVAVSFWTQVFAVGRHDFAYWESLIVAGSTDAGTFAFLFMAREDTYKGRRTWGAWLGSVACAAASVQWNVVTDWAKHDYLGVEFHLFMPALALGTWYWLLHGRKRKATRNARPEPEGAPDPEPEPSAPLPPPPAPEPEPEVSVEPEAVAETPAETPAESNGRGRETPVTLAEAQAAYRTLLRRNGRVSGEALGKELRVSGVSGRKWKRNVEAAAKPAPPFRFREVAA